MKKSQVTIFIIIGIILVGGIVSLIIYKNDIKIINLNSKNINSEVRSIDSMIEDCFYQRSLDAIRLIGLRGGYIYPNSYVDTDFGKISYALKNHQNILVSKKDAEENIKSYLMYALPNCMEYNFDFNFSYEKPEVEVKISRDYVYTSGKLFFSVQEGDDSFTIDRKYETEIYIELGKILESANEIVKKTNQNPDEIDFTYLGESEYNIIFAPYDNETLIYTITYDSIEESYTFAFAVEIK